MTLSQSLNEARGYAYGWKEYLPEIDRLLVGLSGLFSETSESASRSSSITGVSLQPQHPRSAASIIVDGFHISEPPLK